MSDTKGRQYQLNHSKTLLELLEKIIQDKKVGPSDKPSNRDIRGENNQKEDQLET